MTLQDLEAGLTQEQKDELEEARRLIPKLRDQISKAKAAGIDVASQEAELAQLQADIDKLHRVYVRQPRTSRSST